MSALPVDIKQLIHGQIVEWERIEFKAGWNPEPIMQTICAFANDINNWGGGYLLVGVKEKNGQPLLPPVGILPSKLDDIQKKLIALCYKLRPTYFPVVAPVLIEGKHVLAIWVPGGDMRPYQAPVQLAKNSRYAYFIRRNSSTIEVKTGTVDERRLHELANKIPFDDRINHHATLDDLELPLIKSFLKEVNSELYDQADKLPFEVLCRNMQIARGPKEYLRPVNIGLLMFNEHPERFFPATQLDVVEYRDEVGDSFSEKVFTGPLHIQLRSALDYINRQFLKEEVRKLPHQAESLRFYNYPYTAIEEALANAVYHKDYEKREPIEVRIFPNKIEIFSIPGPLPPVTIQSLNAGRAIARVYRNRRIGDFLKELHLTEGRCTGVPKILKALKDNGSPSAKFETDENLSYFLTVLPIHSALPPQTQKYPVETLKSTQSDEKSIQLLSQKLPVNIQQKLDALGKKTPPAELRAIIFELCSIQAFSAKELSTLLHRKDKKTLVRDHLTPMKKEGTLEVVNPKEQAANQKYQSKKI